MKVAVAESDAEAPARNASDKSATGVAEIDLLASQQPISKRQHEEAIALIRKLDASTWDVRESATLDLVLMPAGTAQLVWHLIQRHERAISPEPEKKASTDKKAEPDALDPVGSALDLPELELTPEMLQRLDWLMAAWRSRDVEVYYISRTTDVSPDIVKSMIQEGGGAFRELRARLPALQGSLDTRILGLLSLGTETPESLLDLIGEDVAASMRLVELYQHCLTENALLAAARRQNFLKLACESSNQELMLELALVSIPDGDPGVVAARSDLLAAIRKSWTQAAIFEAFSQAGDVARRVLFLDLVELGESAELRSKWAGIAGEISDAKERSAYIAMASRERLSEAIQGLIAWKDAGSRLFELLCAIGSSDQWRKHMKQDSALTSEEALVWLPWSQLDVAEQERILLDAAKEEELLPALTMTLQGFATKGVVDHASSEVLAGRNVGLWASVLSACAGRSSVASSLSSALIEKLPARDQLNIYAMRNSTSTELSLVKAMDQLSREEARDAMVWLAAFGKDLRSRQLAVSASRADLPRAFVPTWHSMPEDSARVLADLRFANDFLRKDGVDPEEHAELVIRLESNLRVLAMHDLASVEALGKDGGMVAQALQRGVPRLLADAEAGSVSDDSFVKAWELIDELPLLTLRGHYDLSARLVERAAQGGALPDFGQMTPHRSWRILRAMGQAWAWSDAFEAASAKNIKWIVRSRRDEAVRELMGVLMLNGSDQPFTTALSAVLRSQSEEIQVLALMAAAASPDLSASWIAQRKKSIMALSDAKALSPVLSESFNLLDAVLANNVDEIEKARRSTTHTISIAATRAMALRGDREAFMTLGNLAFDKGGNKSDPIESLRATMPFNFTKVVRLPDDVQKPTHAQEAMKLWTATRWLWEWNDADKVWEIRA